MHQNIGCSINWVVSLHQNHHRVHIKHVNVYQWSSFYVIDWNMHWHMSKRERFVNNDLLKSMVVYERTFSFQLVLWVCWIERIDWSLWGLFRCDHHWKNRRTLPFDLWCQGTILCSSYYSWRSKSKAFFIGFHSKIFIRVILV